MMGSSGDVSQGWSSAAAFERADAAAETLFEVVPIDQLAQKCQMALGDPAAEPQGFQCTEVVTDAALLSKLVDGWGAYWLLRLQSLGLLDATELGSIGLETWTEGLEHFRERFPAVEEGKRLALAQALGVSVNVDKPAKCALTKWLSNMEMIAQMKHIAAAIAKGDSTLSALGVLDARGALQALALHSKQPEDAVDLNDLATAPWNVTGDAGSVKGAGTVAIERLVIQDLEAKGTGALKLTPLDDQASAFYTSLGGSPDSLDAHAAKELLKRSRDAGVEKWVKEHPQHLLDD
jgi:hypothetical protein